MVTVKLKRSGESSGASTPQSAASTSKPRAAAATSKKRSRASSSNSEDYEAEENFEAEYASDAYEDDLQPVAEFISSDEDAAWQGESDDEPARGAKGRKGAAAKGKGVARRRQPVRAPGRVVANGAARRPRSESPDSDLGGNDFSDLPLRPDHASRPFYVMPLNRTIVLEAFHPLANQAADFLIAIAEPVSRPQHMHEYKLTMHSLYAAVSVGLDTNDIIDVLSRLSKVPVPAEIVDFIRDCTTSYGKVKLVLKHNRYFVESAEAEPLHKLLNDATVRKCRVVEGEEMDVDEPVLGQDKAPSKGDLVIPGTTKPAQPAVDAAAAAPEGEGGEGERDPGREAEDIFGTLVDLERDDDRNLDDDAVHTFEVKAAEIEVLKREALRLDYPMLEEYDFRNDRHNADLEIDLKPTTQIRPYQEKSLSKMFGNGRARSGIIVLPCGAGKTLVGITAACTIKKSCIVLCTSGVSVMQWKTEFQRWSTIADRQIAVFTADQKEKFTGAAGVVVSTYSMVANRQKRSHDAQKMMDFLTSREWGFIILDEVHVVPAAMFRQVVTRLKTHCKLGLTATLVREDDKIDDLNFLIGPKLYEANWMDLAEKGHIAKVQCAEVWCHMTPEFYREYLREKSARRRLLYVMNPRKFQACQFLIKFHEDRGDKVIVFSDNVFALEAYAKKLGKPYIHGGIAQLERMRILQNFQHNPVVNTIFLSKVGDTSIDLPEATCLIQISSHFGSRRQEAQRLGRILRAKRRNDDGFNAFFYSLVSRDCEEMKYSSKRQQFLIDQGYAFKVITELKGLDTLEGLVYPSRAEQLELLQAVLLAQDKDGEIGVEADQFATGTGKAGRAGVVSNGGKKRPDGAPAAKRIAGSLNALSGATSMSYIEQNRSANAQLKKDGPAHHKLFEKRKRDAKQRKRDREQD